MTAKNRSADAIKRLPVALPGRLDQAGRLLLTDRDREAFLKAVLNPPKPAKRLMNALRRHRQIVG